MALEVGTEAPDFELKDQTNQPVRLSDYRGKKAVVLIFHPLAFSGICQDELCSIRDQISSFRNDDVETMAISVDAHHSHRIWGEQQGFEFPLLSDFWPHGAVAQQYGVFNDTAGLAERGTFVVDKDGIIRFSTHNPIPEARDDAAYLEALRQVGALA